MHSTSLKNFRYLTQALFTILYTSLVMILTPCQMRPYCRNSETKSWHLRYLKFLLWRNVLNKCVTSFNIMGWRSRRRRKGKSCLECHRPFFTRRSIFMSKIFGESPQPPQLNAAILNKTESWRIPKSWRVLPSLFQFNIHWSFYFLVLCSLIYSKGREGKERG